MEASHSPFTFSVPDLGDISAVAQLVPQNDSGKQGKSDPDNPVISIRPGVRNSVQKEPHKRWKGGKLIHPPGTRKGTRALWKQKVVLVTQSQLDALKEGALKVQAVPSSQRRKSKAAATGSVNYPVTIVELPSVKYDTIAVSGCPNPSGEYGDANQAPTHTILCRWTEDTPHPCPVLQFTNPGNAAVTRPVEQTENFIISPRDPNPPPTPPIGGSLTPLVAPDDFKPVTEADDRQYHTFRLGNTPTVAIIDTGLKFNLNNLGQSPGPVDGDYHYRDRANAKKPFRLAYQTTPAPECGEAMNNNHLGCCTLAAYQEQPFLDAMNSRLTAFDPPYSGRPYTGDDVRNSPYDDHVGRHGTVIAAIVQQQAEVAVLPVKSFDSHGFGCLYDVLNAFNYILQRHQQSRIQVVNASWVTALDNPLLRRKIQELKRAGIFLVAAAGNRNQTDNPDLAAQRLYPACYSEEMPNVITVTSVMEHYVLRATKASAKQKGIFANQPALEKAVLTQLGVPPTMHLVTDGLETEANYSAQFVNIGVAGSFGSMPSPFRNGGRIWGSSFATPYVAAKVADYLQQHAISLAGASDDDFREKREEILNAISQTDHRLAAESLVEEGRFLTAS